MLTLLLAALAFGGEAPRDLEDETVQITLRLVGWQAGLGAWMLGPAVAMSSSRWVPPGLTLGGMVVGGVAGAAGGLVYADRSGLTHGKMRAITGAQQLGLLHGATASMLADSWRFGLPISMAIGAGMGTIGGYALASRSPDDGVMSWAWSGAYWGAGLGALVLIGGNEVIDSDAILYVITGSLDAGVLIGTLLSVGFDLDRDTARLANFGGLLGFAGTGAILSMLSGTSIWLQEPAVASILGVGAVAGGITAVALHRSERGPSWVDRAHRSSPDRRVVVGPPMPTMVQGKDGPCPGIQLVNLAF